MKQKPSERIRELCKIQIDAYKAYVDYITRPETSSWEEEFNQTFLLRHSNDTLSGFKIVCDAEFVKDFIRSVASSEYKRGLENCMKMRLGQVEDLK